jgi:hypothetical protein
MTNRPVIFKWRQTEPVLILRAVRRYRRYSLRFVMSKSSLEERGLEADLTTVWRWVQRYGPEMEQRMRHHLKPTNKSWLSSRADASVVAPASLSEIAGNCPERTQTPGKQAGA